MQRSLQQRFWEGLNGASMRPQAAGGGLCTCSSDAGQREGGFFHPPRSCRWERAGCRSLGMLLVGWVLFCLSLGCAVQVEAATEVVKLRGQSPEAVADVVRQLYHGRARVAEAPSIQAVVLYAETKELLEEIKRVIRDLDAPPKTLQFSVRAIEWDARQQTGHSVSLGRHRIIPDAAIAHLQTRGSEVRTIRGMEGYPLGLTDQTTRVLPMATPWGPNTMTLTQTRGLKIMGRCSGPDQVIIEVFYASGKDMSTRQILTQLQVPVNTWVDLGDLTSANTTTGGAVSAGQGLHHEHHRRRDRGQTHYLVKVIILDRH